MNLSDEERSYLMTLRNGCSCFLSPPCQACTEPLSLEEAELLGHVLPMAVEAEATLKTYRKYEMGMAIARPEGRSTWQERLELSGLYDDKSPHKPVNS